MRDMSETTDTPIYTYAEGRWVPDAVTTSMHGTQSGSPVVGAMGTAMIHGVPELNDRVCVSFNSYLLRPVPVAPIEIVVTPKHMGTRLAMVEAEVVVEGRVFAKADAVFMTESSVPEVGPDDVTENPPVTGEPVQRPAPETRASGMQFNSVMERRADRTRGIYWTRLTREFADPFPGFAWAGVLADWAPSFPIMEAKFEGPPPYRLPNVDLCMSFVRAPQGEWLGLKPVPQWYRNGVGLTDTVMYDEVGYLGRVTEAMAFWIAGGAQNG